MADEPLTLTVHSLPQPQEAAREDAQRTVHGRWKMLLVLLVCAAPVIASYTAYYLVRPEARRNFGELIEPQRGLPALTAQNTDGRPVALRSLAGQWLLVTVGGGACDARCEQNLYLQRQIREGLGKDKERLDRVWLVTDQAAIPAALRAALTQATVLRVDPRALGQWLAPAPQRTLEEHLYLVDPQGNWMLRFPAALEAAGASRAKRDLERLMRASASWDLPGR